MKRLIGLTMSAAVLVPAAPAAAQAPAVTLETKRTNYLIGDVLRATGRLSGVGDVSGRRIVAEMDQWPFDGRFHLVARGRTDSAGRFAFRVAPRNNVVIRVRFRQTYSPPVTLWVDRPIFVRERGDSAHPRLRVTMFSWNRRDPARRRTVYGYLAEQEGATYRLVTQRKFTRKTRIRARTTLRYPAGSFDGSRLWMICMPEPTPDRYGRPTETERVCGAPEIAPEPGSPPRPPRVPPGAGGADRSSLAAGGESLGAELVAVLEDLADRHEEADGDGAGGEPLAAEDVALAAGEMGRGGGHARNLLPPGPVHIGVSP